MTELALKVENLKKQYRLGVIGGGTLYGDLQSWWAKVRGKEDPNTKIGTVVDTKKGSFYALKGINFEVKKGERLGIIGGNGAGKSTMLKILSRVTAPTEGTVYINGRISSMLEVGTGFHAELTGRENIYLNGAILGMSKAEVDEKIEDIIEFSECRQFIDTPVKRYSSGMYVKLAFAVAAHLDSEILIMDEVLAVGDINFQQKCLQKMKSLAENEGRTVLYVSHNMSTIRQLCNRCIVLKKGECIFDGEVEKAIALYSQSQELEIKKEYDVSDAKRIQGITDHCHLEKIFVKKGTLEINEELQFDLLISSKINMESAILRFVVFDSCGNTIGTAYSDIYQLKQGINRISMCFPTKGLMPDKYFADLILCEYSKDMQTRHDIVRKAFGFEIDETKVFYNMKWNKFGWGNIKLLDLKVLGESVEEN